MVLTSKESITSVAVGNGWIAIATNKRMLQLFSVGGVQRELISIPGQPITLAGWGGRLAIIYQSGPCKIDIWQSSPLYLVMFQWWIKELLLISLESDVLSVSVDSTLILSLILYHDHLNWHRYISDAPCREWSVLKKEWKGTERENSITWAN